MCHVGRVGPSSESLLQSDECCDLNERWEAVSKVENHPPLYLQMPYGIIGKVYPSFYKRRGKC